MSPELCIVLADDHPIVRKGLRATIEQHSDLKVVGEAEDGRSALKLIRLVQPEIALLDISMPELGGLEVADEIARQKLAVKIVFLTIHCDSALLQKATEAGARGYVLKDTAIGEIVDCIRRVAKGQFYASPALAGQFLRRRRADNHDFLRSDLATLTPTEKEVLKMIADYRTSSEIGEALHTSPRTVDTHRVNICNKLDLHGRHALMKFAVAHRDELE